MTMHMQKCSARKRKHAIRRLCHKNLCLLIVHWPNLNFHIHDMQIRGVVCHQSEKFADGEDVKRSLLHKKKL